ncbi:GNAT family N-acetyltransferase [Sulfobacillus harzensis]|uniref:GNAT family N-acetyltransferase n=1 Tax=Sulfobacillus harzensis TaxID=2729629 RepID=A0A7Y0L4M6_9FIRM|nr:GNAT family protein [Sulfobacillus harzensis]NMP23140.1 GNAT family N-acetyltransferase [Sulfobacillus harzensis]
MDAERFLTDGVVRLRRFRADDPAIDFAVLWYQDREVLDGAGGLDEKPFDRTRIERMYRYLDTHAELYIIEVRDRAQWLPIGDVALAPHTTPIVIGHPGWRSRGIGTRVLALIIGRARELGYPAVWAKEIWAHNVRSQRLFERMGFRRVEEGVDDQGRSWYRYRLDL